MEATASDKSVLARMLSWFFRIVSLKTVPISEQHMIAIHNALFMMAGEFVSQSATTDQHGLNTAMAQALQRNVEGHLNTTLAQYTKDLPALFAEVCLHTNVFCTGVEIPSPTSRVRSTRRKAKTCGPMDQVQGC